MMPTTQQMLAAVQLALKEHVTPKVDDEWAQSALRSVDVILNHLQARVPIEGPHLHKSTIELALLLSESAQRLGLKDGPLSDFVAEARGLPDSYPAVDDLQALNHRGRESVNDLLDHCYSRQGQAAADGVRAEIRGWLLRYADRESPMFFPTFVGRPV